MMDHYFSVYLGTPLTLLNDVHKMIRECVIPRSDVLFFEVLLTVHDHQLVQPTNSYLHVSSHSSFIVMLAVVVYLE